MFVNDQPVRSALFPDAGIANVCFGGLTVFRLFREMHRNSSPYNRAAARDLQIFASRQACARGIVKEFFLNALVIFLPAVVLKRSDVVENQAGAFGVELGGIIRLAGAPRSAIIINQFAELCVVGSFLLSPR